MFTLVCILKGKFHVTILEKMLFDMIYSYLFIVNIFYKIYQKVCYLNGVYIFYNIDILNAVILTLKNNYNKNNIFEWKRIKINNIILYKIIFLWYEYSHNCNLKLANNYYKK